MGLILGALLGVALILTDKGISQFLVSSSSPLMNMAVFIGYFCFVVGTGATMTGYIFITIERDALKVKQQTQRINQRRGPE